MPTIRAEALRALAVLFPVALVIGACKDPAPVAVALSLAVHPSATATNGIPFSQQPSIQLVDDKGKPVPTSGVVVTVALAAGGPALGGTLTATTNASGLATFTDLAITGLVGTRGLEFTAPNLTATFSEGTTVIAGTTTSMKVTIQPSPSAQSGLSIGQQPQLQMEDVSGNPTAQAGITVTATTISGTGTITNAVVVSNVNGVAAFTGLTISGLVGSYTLTFIGAGVQRDAANPTVLSAGPVAQLLITTQPATSAQGGIPLSPQPVLRVRDAAGNFVTTAGLQVTASTVGNTSTLSGATATTNSSGFAVFSSLTLTGAAGSHTLRFTTSGAPAVDAAAPTTLTTSTATKLSISTQPSATASSGVALTTQPVIQLRDVVNNAVSTAGVVVTATTVNGAGTITNSTATTNASGVATFSGLAISGTPNYYTLRFTSPSLTSIDASKSTILDGGPTGCTLSSTPDTDNDRLPDCAEGNTGVYVGTTNTGTKPNDSDTDDDGIKDGDEVLGSTGGLDLPGLGVNPLRRDILLEYDWFDDAVDVCGAHSHKPTANTIAKVVAMFAAAPTSNPNGTTGVNIISDYGQGGVFTGGNLIADADGVIASGVSGTDFQNYKAANLAADRQAYFHYVLLPHRYNNTSTSSGQAEINGNDLIVSLYCAIGGASGDQNVANTIAHELGHNLGLLHGGNVNTNWKPNYNSVMNYRYQFPGIDNDCTPPGNGVLSYSVGTRPPLDENNLDETQGICGNPPGPGFDWNANGVATDVGYAKDINNVSSDPTSVDNLLGVLTDYNDWANIYFFGIPGGATAGAALTAPQIASCADVPAFLVRGR